MINNTGKSIKVTKSSDSDLAKELKRLQAENERLQIQLASTANNRKLGCRINDSGNLVFTGIRHQHSPWNFVPDFARLYLAGVYDQAVKVILENLDKCSIREQDQAIMEEFVKKYGN